MRYTFHAVHSAQARITAYQYGQIQKQFFLNTHDDWGKALKIRCLGTRNRRRILDRLNTMTNIQGAHLHVQT
jgi:hypothetical protein